MIKTYIHRGMHPVVLPGVYVPVGAEFNANDWDVEWFNGLYPGTFEEIPEKPEEKPSDRHADTEEAKP